MEVQSFTKGSAFSFKDKQAKPMIIEKESTCSIFPSENAAIGLEGMMFSKVPRRLLNSTASTFTSVATI